MTTSDFYLNYYQSERLDLTLNSNSYCLFWIDWISPRNIDRQYWSPSIQNFVRIGSARISVWVTSTCILALRRSGKIGSWMLIWYFLLRMHSGSCTWSKHLSNSGLVSNTTISYQYHLSRSRSELEDVVSFSSDTIATLSLLDSSLRRYISLCASYHGCVWSRAPCFLTLIRILCQSVTYKIHYSFNMHAIYFRRRSFSPFIPRECAITLLKIFKLYATPLSKPEDDLLIYLFTRPQIRMSSILFMHSSFTTDSSTTNSWDRRSIGRRCSRCC